jgi:putative membrane protein
VEGQALENSIQIYRFIIKKECYTMGDILTTIIYAFLGILLMLIGNILIDVVIPCNFPEEIKKRNVAVGYITAGSSITVGIILRSAVISPVISEASQSLLEGIGNTILYFLIGMIFCILGYFLIKVFNKKYDLNKEIASGNPAAGLMVMGMFIGLGIVISGVIY